MKRTFADRPNWRRVIDKRFKLTFIENESFQGYVSFIYIDKVREPLKIEVAGKELCLADNGFIWMQHFPSACNYALTTMIDNQGEIVQWYFDICTGNKIDSAEIPYYDDLYLDVVLLPSGEILLLDEDELLEALENKDITKEQYDLAYVEAHKIMEAIRTKKGKLPLNSQWYLKHITSLEK